MGKTKFKVGSTRKTLQGMTSTIIQYIDDDNILVHIKEVDKTVWTNLKTYKHGLIRTNISNSHIHSVEECRDKSFFNNVASIRLYALGVTILSIALIVALIISLICCK